MSSVHGRGAVVGGGGVGGGRLEAHRAKKPGRVGAWGIASSIETSLSDEHALGDSALLSRLSGFCLMASPRRMADSGSTMAAR